MKADLIIGYGIFIGSELVLAYVAAHYEALTWSVFEALYQGIHPFIVESHSVDQALVFWQSEQAGLRIALLREGCDGTYLHESKTQGGHGLIVLTILVEACREAYGIGEAKAK